MTRTTTRTTTTTTRTRTRTRTRRRTRSNNNNDDNEDAARSMSCPQVQMKSPSLFPSPDPYRHRRCAKLYNKLEKLRTCGNLSPFPTGFPPATACLRLFPVRRHRSTASLAVPTAPSYSMALDGWQGGGGWGGLKTKNHTGCCPIVG